MATGNERVPAFHGATVAIRNAFAGSGGARRVPMLRAVPGYGLVMSFDEIDAAASGLDSYRLVSVNGSPTIADVKSFD